MFLDKRHTDAIKQMILSKLCLSCCQLDSKQHLCKYQPQLRPHLTETKPRDG